jgi:hypothetical protein
MDGTVRWAPGWLDNTSDELSACIGRLDQAPERPLTAECQRPLASAGAWLGPDERRAAL